MVSAHASQALTRATSLPIIQWETWGQELSSIIAKLAPGCDINIEAVSPSKVCNQQRCLGRAHALPSAVRASDHVGRGDSARCAHPGSPRAPCSAWDRADTQSVLTEGLHTDTRVRDRLPGFGPAAAAECLLGAGVFRVRWPEQRSETKPGPADVYVQGGYLFKGL